MGANISISKAQQKAVHKYVKANYDRAEITLPKGKKAKIQAHAQAHGKSVNGFINRAIDNQIAQDKNESQPWRAGSRFYTVYRKEFTR